MPRAGARKCSVTFCAAAVFLGTVVLLPTAADAGPITQAQLNWSVSIDLVTPIAQSFTAVDPFLQSIGFGFEQYDLLTWPGPVQTPTSAVFVMELRQGDGMAGAVLATQQFTITSFFRGIFDVDFGGMPLTVGGAYTAVLIPQSFSPDSSNTFVDIFQSNAWGQPDAYVGGQAYIRGQPLDAPGYCCTDLQFRVLPATVPEPSTWLLLGSGLAAAAARRRFTNRT